MASHMGVQRFATRRSEQVEILVGFILQEFATRLLGEGHIASTAIPIPQMSFERPDCSDVFDHYVELDLARPVNGVTGELQLWAQTTCYKGNKAGRPESNKTYEIRETLIESLGLRRWLRDEGETFRTIHFTVGPANYTYGWFPLAKDNAFDLSLYLSASEGSGDLFEELSLLLENTEFEYEQHERLEGALRAGGSQVAELIRETGGCLYEWFVAGMPTSLLADQQADLLHRLSEGRQEFVSYALSASKMGGEGIKGRATKLLEGDGETSDPVMRRTLRRTWKNPFVPAALEAESDWAVWSEENFAVPCSCPNLASYIRYLWQAEHPSRGVNRRLLLRIHAQESIPYIQDLGVDGVTEHNLYGGDHSTQQAAQITGHIISSCQDAGIETLGALYARLVSNRAKRLLRSSRRFEVRNGTMIRPSFFYVEEALMSSGCYKLEPLSQTKLARPVAYHAAFGAANVRPYTNLKAVVDQRTRQPLAIIKAKFFRKPEFPRRAKEEAYVGLTTRFQYEGGAFTERYGDVPLIMFVDMVTDLVPPEYAVRRLVTAGWDVFFSIDELKSYLDSLAERKASSQDSLADLPLFSQ